MVYLISTFLFIIMQITPEQVVQKQLDTYNNRDIKGFMSVMSQDISLYNLGDQKPIASGYEQVKGIYTNLFEQSPQLKSELLNRMVMGSKVIDHESITGRMGSEEVIELIVVYEVRESLISKITVIRK